MDIKERSFVGTALLWKRLIAFFIDIIILNLIVLFPFRRLFQSIIPKDYSFSEAYQFLSNSTNYTSYLASISFVISTLMIIYFFMMEKRMSQTIGKMFMKLYVVSNDNTIKNWQLLIRNIVFIPMFPFILLWILDPLFMFFSKTNQRLTEILSKTRVVEKYQI
ncbi:RDD family protein [Candidatus Woesearchaeota archaeon]|nr:RDD family protein [Candidatus Woesearchaeota archaeon]